MAYEIIAEREATLPMEAGPEHGMLFDIVLKASTGAQELQTYFVADSQVKEEVLGAAGDLYEAEIMKVQS